MVKMNGLRPPVTAPPGFAVRRSLGATAYNSVALRAGFGPRPQFRLPAHSPPGQSCWGCRPKPAFDRRRRKNRGLRIFSFTTGNAYVILGCGSSRRLRAAALHRPGTRSRGQIKKKGGNKLCFAKNKRLRSSTPTAPMRTTPAPRRSRWQFSPSASPI